jgi:hypothetical protein
MDISSHRVKVLHIRHLCYLFTLVNFASSARTRNLTVTPHRTLAMGYSFTVGAWGLWNSHPHQIKNERALKCFGDWWGRTLRDCYFLRDWIFFSSGIPKTNGTTILERGLAICGLRPYRVYRKVSRLLLPTPHIGHSRHGLFFTRWIVNPMLNLLKRTMTYPGFEPGAFRLAVSIANHYTIWVVLFWDSLSSYSLLHIFAVFLFSFFVTLGLILVGKFILTSNNIFLLF